MENVLIGAEDLAFGRKNIFARAAASLAAHLPSIRAVNRLYDKTFYSGERCAAHLLELLDVKYRTTEPELGRIPLRGPVVFISNHPTGALDGVVLIDLISKIRPEVKFMGNYLLNRIQSLSDYFIKVDPFENSNKAINTTGLKHTLKQINEGGALVIFPAGEVSTWHNKWGIAEDRPWEETVVKLIGKLAVPVVPIWIECRNSSLFHFAGKIDPRLRTMLLPHEFANKKHAEVAVKIGFPVSNKLISSLDTASLVMFLRSSVDMLGKQKVFETVPNRASDITKISELIDFPPSTDKVEKELERIRNDSFLFSRGKFHVFSASGQNIPTILREIGVRREHTFRAVGEGTMTSIDIDRFDNYYTHIFLWDSETRKVAGAYRVGLGHEIMCKYGLEGFYTNTLFRMSAPVSDILHNCVELGRSFISVEYQRALTPLMLLWKGIFHILTRDNYRYVIGPATIPGNLKTATKSLLLSWLKHNYMDLELSNNFQPINGTGGIPTLGEAYSLKGIWSHEHIEKLMSDAEGTCVQIPVLIKKYLAQNSRVLGFNVDPAFRDGLDVLMLLDIRNVPESTVSMLSK